MAWVKEVGELLIAYDAETIPQVGELDELEMRNALARKHLNSIQVNGRAFVGQKKAARPRADVRRKGMLAKTTKSSTGRR